jgi:hypothetical protein
MEDLTMNRRHPAFDYSTIADVILHIRYTARQGVDATKVKAALDDLLLDAGQSQLALLFSVRQRRGSGIYRGVLRVPYGGA